MDADLAEPSPSPSGSSPYVGVDVVDLRADRLRDRPLNPRFLDRVFTAAERRRIEAATDGRIETWSLWAAKEAAFKVVTKVLGSPPVFEHRAFEVSDPPGSPVTSVRYGDLRVDATVQTDPDHVLVHAWNDPASLVLVSEMMEEDARRFLQFCEPFDSWCGSRFSPEEREALHSRASAFVRLLARADAARFLDLKEERLSIRAGAGTAGRRPPYLYVDGRESAHTDLSFSHHGNRLAWALALPFAGDPLGPPGGQADGEAA